MIKYADLGGALVCNYMKSSTDSNDAAEQKFGEWSLWDPNGGQYLPTSAIHGMRIVLSCENH